MLLDMLQEKRANLPALAAEDLFSGMLQSRLGKMIVKRAGLKYQTPLQSLNDEQLLACVKIAKWFTLAVEGVMGFDSAQVTAGGVSTREFDARTLESTISPGRPDWISDPMPGLEKTFRLMPHRLLGEGHYCAVLRKAGDAPGEELPLEPAAKRPKELDDFCKQTGAALPEGKIILFGQNVYLAPEDLPSLKGLHVLRAGLEL